MTNTNNEIKVEEVKSVSAIRKHIENALQLGVTNVCGFLNDMNKEDLTKGPLETMEALFDLETAMILDGTRIFINREDSEINTEESFFGAIMLEIEKEYKEHEEEIEAVVVNAPEKNDDNELFFDWVVKVHKYIKYRLLELSVGQVEDDEFVIDENIKEDVQKAFDELGELDAEEAAAFEALGLNEEESNEEVEENE